MMGMMVVHGAQAGGFSPISIYGSITNSVMEDAGLPNSEIVDLPVQPGREHDPGRDPVRGARWPRAAEQAGRSRRGRGHDRRRRAARRRRQRHRRGGPARPPETTTQATGVRRDQVLTLVAFVGVALVALDFDKNIGFVAITAAVVLHMLAPKEHQDAVKQIAWPTVLLVAGVSTYAFILEEAGSPEFVGKWAAGLGVAALGALVLCYVGGVVSAFASSTALLPIIIPIGLPLIADGGISAGLFVAALAVSSTIVDVSPFSTNGALMLANRPRHDQRAGVLQADPDLRRHRHAGSVRSSSGQLSCCRGGDLMGPLEDVLVVDLSRALAGPHATMMLGDLGARVIKVEAPGHGDDTRGWGPPFVGEPDDPRVDVLPLDEPQQGVDRARPQGRGTTATCCCSWSTGPTCWSRTSAPACSSGSGSASSRCRSATRGWSCCRSPASGTTGPRAAARATTRSRRARPA